MEKGKSDEVWKKDQIEFSINASDIQWARFHTIEKSTNN